MEVVDRFDECEEAQPAFMLRIKIESFVRNNIFHWQS